MDKVLLLASFIQPSELDDFLTQLEERFEVDPTKVFFFKNLTEKGKNIATFRLTIKQGERVDFKTNFFNTIPIHKKGTAIYTINALNKLIEFESELEIGNICYQNHKINWSDYQNKLILISGEELVFYDIEQFFM